MEQPVTRNRGKGTIRTESDRVEQRKRIRGRTQCLGVSETSVFLGREKEKNLPFHPEKEDSVSSSFPDY